MTKTQCPHCQATFKLKDDSLIGQVRPCAKCGKKFRVQDADDMADEEIEVSLAPTRSKKSGKGKKKSGGNGLLLGIGGGVAVVCVLAGVYFAFLRGGRGGGGDDGGGLSTGDQTVDADPIDVEYNSEAISQACQNFYDSTKTYPHPEVGPEGQTGLSWRVHILSSPSMDQKYQDLHSQFHLSEPWDSPHNKTLIDKMPSIFKTPGVSDAGKTAWHMFSGPGAPGEKGPVKDRDIHGVSLSTILCILGSAETATEWTRPGGVALNAATPLQFVGTPTDGTFPVVLFDGRSLKLKSLTPTNDIVALIGINDEITVAGDPGGTHQTVSLFSTSRM